MLDQANATPAYQRRVPWNKGKRADILCPTSNRRFVPTAEVMLCLDSINLSPRSMRYWLAP